MKFLEGPRHPFLGLALAAGLGILVADHAVIPPVLTLVLVVALTSIAALRTSSPFTYIAITAGFFCLHSVNVHGTAGQTLAARLGSRGRSVAVRGLVVTEPKTAGSGFSTFVFQLESITLDGSEESSSAKLFVRWRGTPRYADRLALFGSAEPIPPPRNPGEFDLQSHLAREDIRTQLFCRYAENGDVVEARTGNLFLRGAAAARTWMRTTLSRGLEDSPDVQGLISGMVLGIRHETPDDIEEPFQQTGTLHLFAVAGLHVGIVAQLLWLLALAARIPRKWATAAIIPLLFFYVAITGLHTSSIRAAVMSSVLLAGLFADRQLLPLNALAAAAFIILCCDSNELFSAGFQLSFAVVTAIFLLSGPIFRRLARLGDTDPFLPPSLIGKLRKIERKVWRWFAQGAAVSLAAWAGSLPLIVWYFNLITPVAVIANMAVVPVAFFVLAAGMISMLFAPASLSVSVLFNNANWALARFILGVVHLLAEIPGGHLYVERPHWPTTSQAEMTVLDEGVGAAVHLRAAGEDWLFDAGPAGDYGRLLRPYLHSRGLGRLSGLLLSHGDAQHIGGASGIVEDFEPREIVDSPAPDRSATHRDLIANFSLLGLHRSQLVAGDTIAIGRSISARVLFPPPGFAAKIADDQALVLQLMIGSQRVLMMSDSGLATEQALLRSGAELRSDILIKGQHRSGVSGSPEFLDAVRPQLIIATSRDFPDSERIAEEWSAAVAARGIRLLRQDQTGAVVLRFWRDHWEAVPLLSYESFRSSSR